MIKTTKIFVFSLLFLLSFSFIIQISILGKSDNTILVERSKLINSQFIYNATNDRNVYANRIAQINFQDEIGLDLGNINSTIYPNAQSYKIAEIKDQPLPVPNPTDEFNSMGLNITSVSGTSEQSAITLITYNSFNFSEFVYGIETSKIHKNFLIGFYNATSTCLAYYCNFETKNLGIYLTIGVETLYATIPNFFANYDYATHFRYYLSFASRDRIIFGCSMYNSTAGVIGNGTTITIPNFGTHFGGCNKIFNRLTMGTGYSALIYAIDSNYHLEYKISPFKTYLCTTNKTTTISNVYLTAKSNNVKNYIANYSTINENPLISSFEGFNYLNYNKYRINSTYRVNQNERIYVENQIVSQFKSKFEFNYQAWLSKGSGIQFNFTNFKLTLVTSIANASQLYIIKTINSIDYLVNYVNISNLINSSMSLKLSFLNKNLQLVILTEREYIVHNFYLQNSVLLNISFYAQIEVCNIRYLQMNSDFSVIKLCSNATRDIGNQIYTNNYILDLINIMNFREEISIPALTEYNNEIEYDSETYYYKQTNIAYIEVSLSKNFIGITSISDSIITIQLTNATTNITKIYLVNNYRGLTNVTFLNTNGGIVLVTGYLTETDESERLLSISFYIIYHSFYEKNLGLDLYITTAMDMLLPMIVLSVFVIALYGISKSKFLGLFGFLLGLVILFLIDMISLTAFIFLLIIQIIATFFIVKSESKKGDEL